MTHPLLTWQYLIAIIAVGLTVLLVMLASLVWLLRSQPPPTASPVVESVPDHIAIVNGTAIPRDRLRAEIIASRFNVFNPVPNLSEEDYRRAETEALNQLVTRALVIQAAEQQGFSLEADYINSRVELLYGSSGEKGQDELQQALTEADITYDDLFWWVEQVFIVEEFVAETVLADIPSEQTYEVYNAWLNELRAQADVQIFLPNQPTAAVTDAPAPTFSLPGLQGESIALADYHGQIVLVNFWASWCPPCLSEMPDYEQVYQAHQPDLVVLGINMQEDAGTVQQFAAGLQLTFPILLDLTGDVTNRQYQVTGLPSSFLIDRQGQIFYRHVGPMTRETLEAKLREVRSRE